MAVRRELIQAIRMKQLDAKARPLIEQGQTLAAEVLNRSGLAGTALDPRKLNCSPQELEALRLWLKQETQESGDVQAEQSFPRGRQKI